MQTYIPVKDKILELHSPSKAVAYYPDFQIDLITGRKTKSNLLSVLKKIKPGFQESASIWHFQYELGFIFRGLFEYLKENTLLAVQLEYEQESWHSIHVNRDVELTIISEPNEQNYNENFKKIQEHLNYGDCYQVNYTEPFIYQTKNNFKELVLSSFAGPKTGAFAHASWIDKLNFGVLSQSPECLFRVLKKKGRRYIQTMPIKGSIKFDESNDLFQQKWQELTYSMKDQAELFIIVDLLRNDINSIGAPCAKVKAKKLPLIVNDILHQYSLIEAELDDDTNLLTILEKMHPGGSVTGAPKLRVMQIIQDLEKRERQFYCGSTFVQHKEIFAASINIRTAKVVDNNVFYQAGGGITVQSDVHNEFQEMFLKNQSFLRSFQ